MQNPRKAKGQHVSRKWYRKKLTPSAPQFIRPIDPTGQNIQDILEKKSLFGVRSPCVGLKSFTIYSSDSNASMVY